MYRILPALTYLDEGDLLEIEQFAYGMGEKEVLDYFALTIEELQSADTPDLKYFYMAFKRGRARAKRKAVDQLFSCMGDKNGAQACVAYLRSFASEWPSDSEVAGASSGKFSFNVVMNDGKPL